MAGAVAVETWLAAIRLERYAQAFLDHRIERDQLADLTDDNLRELGMSIGDRQRFRAALLGEMPRGGAWIQAERRPLTMIFVDLVGSSKLAEILIPEDLMELLKRYEEFCRGPIEKFGGRIVRMVGDGLLSYFGHPIANENDPERAVRAALGITRAVGDVSVPGGEPMAVRIGIATGPVVVGDLRTKGRVWQDTVVGTAPNLAARLQQLAPVNGVVIAEETHDHLRGRFQCAALGENELRGLSRARRAWLVLGEADLSREAVRNRSGGVFGRDAELALLDAFWADACAGQGRVAVISGEAGIGKSRLVEAALARLDIPNARAIRLEGGEFDLDSPLRPLAIWLQRTASGTDDLRVDWSDRLRRRLPGWAEAAPVLGFLLDDHAAAAARADLPGAAPHATPEQVREATLAALQHLVLAAAAEAPLCLVVEDLHWCDPTTLEWIGRVAGAIAERRVLLLATTRAGADLPAGMRPGPACRHVALAPLADEHVANLARSMLLDVRISPAVLRAIQRKAGGTPLFVEEVVRTLVARDEIAIEHIDEADPLIPANVHEALAGRLDRLGDDKAVAQAAAVIGPDIRHDLLVLVCEAELGFESARVTSAMAHLRHVGILADGSLGVPSSSFAHGVIRDAAYGSLLRDRRQALHRAVARTLHSRLGEVAEAQPAAVAHHLAEGNDPQASLPHWLAAARQNLARSALLEARRILRRGLLALDSLAPTPALLQMRLEFLALLGPVLLSLEGPRAAVTIENYTRARQVAEQLPQRVQHFPIHWGWWRVSQDCFTWMERSGDLLKRARAVGDPQVLMQAHHCCWATDFHAGDMHGCRLHIGEGLRLYEQFDLRHHGALYGNHDAKVCGHGELAMVEWVTGHCRTALAESRKAEAWAQLLGHLGTFAHDLEVRLDLQYFRRDADALRHTAHAMMRLAEDHGMNEEYSKAQIFLGWARSVGGESLEGLRLLQEGVTRQRDSGTHEDWPMYAAMEAEALLRANQPDAAREMLEQQLALFAAEGWRFWSSEARRLQAEAMHAATGRAPPSPEVCATFLDAVDIAQRQGATMLALRAASGLAALAPDETAIALVRHHAAAIAEPDDGPDIAAARQMPPEIVATTAPLATR